jgi:phosphatidylserine/phosphatidylglycerophosphate/cardiolipin synthase-like enzyme
MSSSASAIGDISFGTGLDIYHKTLLPAIEAAQHEVLLVTCFWARSPSLEALGESLFALNSRAVAEHRRVRVRIGFSSTSIVQKILGGSGRPRVYSSREWWELLGLPRDLGELQGLDVSVTSIFFLPFSVWHPKFVVVDRRRAYLPSCNVSWEEWFEVCISFSGPIVREFVGFWMEYWQDASSSSSRSDEEAGWDASSTVDIQEAGNDLTKVRMIFLLCPGDFLHVLTNTVSKCLFLPSPHNRNPNFRLPWQSFARPPQTPLNDKLLELFATAREEIYIQTPNLTSPPVLQGLTDALRRGVKLHILTSARLMILEQLVTAGTTTDRCVRRFIKTYQDISKSKPRQSDIEMGLLPPGRLHVSYYQPRAGAANEPVQSHAKLTLIDREVIVFGSGNMDRASWYTSQELGVAVYSKPLVASVMEKLNKETNGRSRVVFDSATP